MRKIFGAPKGARYEDEENTNRPQPNRPIINKPQNQNDLANPNRPGMDNRPIEKPAQFPPKLSPKTPSNSTLIGEGIVFNGEIKGNGMIRVEGKLIGTIDIQNSVVVGEDGIVEGDIHSKMVSVLGRVHGNVIAMDKISIDGSGRMIGDIIAPRVAVAEGAVYKGKIDMEPRQQSKKELPKDHKGKGQQKPNQQAENPHPEDPAPAQKNQA